MMRMRVIAEILACVPQDYGLSGDRRKPACASGALIIPVKSISTASQLLFRNIGMAHGDL